jgi:hypothetical protein
VQQPVAHDRPRCALRHELTHWSHVRMCAPAYVFVCIRVRRKEGMLCTERFLVVLFLPFRCTVVALCCRERRREEKGATALAAPSQLRVKPVLNIVQYRCKKIRKEQQQQQQKTVVMMNK